MSEEPKYTWEELLKAHGTVGPDFLANIHEWQLCPKCNGQGYVLTGMVHNSVDTCDVCNGKKIISKINGLPPQ